MRLAGKVAVVTGGARRIGRARVAIADRALPEASAVASAIGREAFAVPVDVASTASIKATVASIVRSADGIDMSVNDAGVYDSAPLLDVTVAQVDRLLSVNVRGLFLTLQAMAAHLVESGRRGSIVDLASQAGRHGEGPSAMYAATKSAVISRTQAAATALMGKGIRLNAIAPGVIDTPMSEHVDALFAELENIPAGAMLERTAHASPYGRHGRPDEIAGAAVCLASAEAEYAVRQTLDVDGGNVRSYVRPAPPSSYASSHRP